MELTTSVYIHRGVAAGFTKCVNSDLPAAPSFTSSTGLEDKMSMARGVRPRGTFQRARRGRPPNSSLAVIDTTLAESPLHKRTVTESGVQ